jgi:hypothetical protein
MWCKRNHTEIERRRWIIFAACIIFFFELPAAEHKTPSGSSSENSSTSDFDCFEELELFNHETTEQDKKLINAFMENQSLKIYEALNEGANPNHFYFNPLELALKKEDLTLATFLKAKGARIDWKIKGEVSLIEMLENVPSQEKKDAFKKLFADQLAKK